MKDCKQCVTNVVSINCNILLVHVTNVLCSILEYECSWAFNDFRRNLS